MLYILEISRHLDPDSLWVGDFHYNDKTVVRLYCLYYNGMLTCQSQSGVSLSLHLGSKMKIFLWPQKQLVIIVYETKILLSYL